MYLELSAMVLMEHHRSLETDGRRARLEAIRREVLRPPTGLAETASEEVAGVPIGDCTSRRRDRGADLGWR
jgi:hypothetical protein